MREESVLDPTGRRLRSLLAEAQAAGRLPSVVAGLVRDGEPVWRAAAGEWSGAPAGSDAYDVQYRIGSITKTLTAVLVLQAARERLVDLDAPASAVLGEVGYADRSLRSLLAHGGGLQSEPAGAWWERSDGLDWAELVAGNDGSGAVFGPGERYHYSNLGYALLGEVAARAFGQPWWTCVRERILQPLGMSRTSYAPEAPAAQGYSVHPYAGTLHPEPATDTRAMAPAGQLWSTLADLSTYARFLLQGDPAVLDPEDLRSATHVQAGDREDALDSAHGLGFQLVRGGSGMLVGHSGSMPGFLAGCFVDPVRRAGAVVLANATTGFTPARLAVALLAELEGCEPTVPRPWRPTGSVPPELADVLGVWHWGNTPFVFSLEGGQVVCRRQGEERFRFAVRDGEVVGTTGYHAGERLRVVRRQDGTVSHLDIATFVFTRTPYDPDAPIPGGPIPGGP